MNKEDIILTALKVLMIDGKGDCLESRKAVAHLIEEALNPKSNEEEPCCEMPPRDEEFAKSKLGEKKNAN